MEKKCASCDISTKSSRNFIQDADSDFLICEPCIKEYNKALSFIGMKKGTKEKLPSAKDIYNHLSEYIIGQENAKKTLSIAVARHYRKLINPNISKSNMLILGPTGTGKTEMIRCLSSYLTVPCLIVDATSFTTKGYVGEDVDNIIKRLYFHCGGDVDLAEKAIIFIDEIDKIAQRGMKDSGINSTAVQQELLKIIEGTKIDIPSPSESQNSLTEPLGSINTENILFICSGAFEGLDLIKNPEMTIGVDEKKNKIFKEKIKPKDLITYGLIPELMGRFPLIAETTPLEKEDLISILKNSKKSLIQEVKNTFSPDKNTLLFSKDFLEQTASLALSRKLGARGLKQIIDDQLKDLYFDLGEIKNKKITIKWNNIQVSSKWKKKSRKTPQKKLK